MVPSYGITLRSPLFYSPSYLSVYRSLRRLFGSVHYRLFPHPPAPIQVTVPPSSSVSCPSPLPLHSHRILHLCRSRVIYKLFKLSSTFSSPQFVTNSGVSQYPYKNLSMVSKYISTFFGSRVSQEKSKYFSLNSSIT